MLGSRCGAQAAPRERPHPRLELLEREGLGHEVIGAEVESFDPLVDAFGSGQHQHGNGEPRARSLRSTSRPCSRGKPRSRINRSNSWVASAASACEPVETWSTAYPEARSERSNASARTWSSSAIRIRMGRLLGVFSGGFVSSGRGRHFRPGSVVASKARPVVSSPEAASISHIPWLIWRAQAARIIVSPRAVHTSSFCHNPPQRKLNRRTAWTPPRPPRRKKNANPATNQPVNAAPVTDPAALNAEKAKALQAALAADREAVRQGRDHAARRRRGRSTTSRSSPPARSASTSRSASAACRAAASSRSTARSRPARPR